MNNNPYYNQISTNTMIPSTIFYGPGGGAGGNGITSPLHLGDRIVMIDSFGNARIGMTGTFILENDNNWGIRFDINFGGHDLDGHCPVGYGYWLEKYPKLIRVIGTEVHAKEEPKEKPIEFNLKALDALIISEDTKKEIEAVLKQHKNFKKLFEEWGLGETIEYGKGMIFCFWGTPGTGKTHAAHCISKVTGCELLIISAAEIESSEPGAANRNIQAAFQAAKEGKKILFLDECDSLITSRNDVGMVLGGQINSLLTEIEKFEGICILATNRIETLDEALERRISLIVEFPEPNHEQRHAIWKRLIPSKMPLEEKVVLERLADHKLTGGQIKNAVLQAARLALSNDEKHVSLEHFESAIERIKQSKSLMGSESRYRQGIREDYVKTRGTEKI